MIIINVISQSAFGSSIITNMHRAKLLHHQHSQPLKLPQNANFHNQIMTFSCFEAANYCWVSANEITYSISSHETTTAINGKYRKL